ncbi:MAG: aminotransferase class III-fold pyridoxal phosphate-dependent enzyme, partial [Spirochaetia bacterium]|nr:aminotransferase class III-fold pyridoxal phosphate-dependent enzyme [Spirochaetia bacterium]
RKGKILADRLQALKAKVSIIGDIRAKGLMIGTEFINPKAEPDLLGSYPPGGEIAVKVQRKCFENRLILERGGREGAVTRCLCALNVTDAEIEQAMAIFEKAVMEVDADVKR